MDIFVQFVTVLVPVVGGVFALVRYLDVRNRELKAQRYQTYSELIRTLSGLRPDGSQPFVGEQISAIYQLPEFTEFKKTSIDIVEALMKQPEWKDVLGEYARKVIAILREDSTT